MVRDIALCMICAARFFSGRQGLGVFFYIKTGMRPISSSYDLRSQEDTVERIILSDGSPPCKSSELRPAPWLASLDLDNTAVRSRSARSAAWCARWFLDPDY